MDNIREIMEWYVEAGVDTLLEEHPINRFSEPLPPPRQKAAQPTGHSPAERLAQKDENKPRPVPKAKAQATMPDGAAIEMAKEIAAKVHTLEELKEAMADFEGCNLKRTAKSLVFSDGNPQANIMLIGEAPDRDEDIQGLPFVGRTGQLLDRMLAAINLSREDTYITNVISWRPPGNRTPTVQEIEIFRPFIERHIELAKPELVLLLGILSSKILINDGDGIMKLRGKWTEIKTGKTSVKTLPTLHPAYLLKQPAHKRLVWQDLLNFKQSLCE